MVVEESISSVELCIVGVYTALGTFDDSAPTTDFDTIPPPSYTTKGIAATLLCKTTVLHPSTLIISNS